jgi:hypothetical protein
VDKREKYLKRAKERRLLPSLAPVMNKASSSETAKPKRKWAKSPRMRAYQARREWRILRIMRALKMKTCMTEAVANHRAGTLLRRFPKKKLVANERMPLKIHLEAATQR